MLKLVSLAAAAAVLLLAAPSALSQIDSHCLLEKWPLRILPKYATAPPDHWSKELSAPLLEEKVTPRILKGGTSLDDVGEGKGKRDATTLLDMCPRPRAAIEMAQEGRYKEAVEAGKKVLDEPREAYYEYTWDYLCNALAWSQIQSGEYEDAAATHEDVAKRIDDANVRAYHATAARMIRNILKPPSAKPPEGQEPPKPEDLKDYAKYRELLRRELESTTRQFTRTLPAMGKSGLGYLLDNANVLYPKLRFVMAADPEVAEPLHKDFCAAVDSLAGVYAAKAMEKAEAQYQRMTELEKGPISIPASKEWNAELQNLWAQIAEVKRLCRIYDYLRRAGLTGSGDVASLFSKAHDLHYCPNDKRYIYKLAGLKTAGGIDLNRRGPAPP